MVEIIERAGEAKVNILDEINQLTIFDVMNDKKKKTLLEADDEVVIRFYTDEIEMVRIKYLYLMGVGKLVKKKNDFWLVEFDGKYEWIEEKRLMLKEDD